MLGTAFCNIIGIGLNGAKTNSLWFGMHFRYSSHEIPNLKLPFAVNVTLNFSLMTRIIRLGCLWLNCCIVIQFKFFFKFKYENKIN